MDLVIIKKIASDVRRQFAARLIEKRRLKHLYNKYHYVKDMDLFLSRAEMLFPSLNCGLTSLYLRKSIGEGKIINGKYGKENHTFLLLNKNIVVDITADQYGGPSDLPPFLGPTITSKTY